MEEIFLFRSENGPLERVTELRVRNATDGNGVAIEAVDYLGDNYTLMTINEKGITLWPGIDEENTGLHVDDNGYVVVRKGKSR